MVFWKQWYIIIEKLFTGTPYKFTL